MFRKSGIVSALLASALAAGSATAASDPVGDFLATYTGTQRADLDFTSATARFDGVNFNLNLTLAGPVTPNTPGLLHVWGINRGAGTPRLNILADPDVEPILWDSLAVLFNDGTLRVVAFPPVGAPVITPIAGGAVINGNSISAAVPLALLPSRGFDPTGYSFQLWSRLRVNPAQDGPNTELADLGPRLFAAVPEPTSWALMIGGFGLAGAALRRRSGLRRAIA